MRRPLKRKRRERVGGERPEHDGEERRGERDDHRVDVPVRVVGVRLLAVDLGLVRISRKLSSVRLRGISEALLSDGTGLNAAESTYSDGEDRERDRDQRDEVAPPQVAEVAALRGGRLGDARAGERGLRVFERVDRRHAQVLQ